MLKKLIQNSAIVALIAVIISASVFALPGKTYARKLKVVGTLTDYAYIASYIGGDKVETYYICAGDQDAHFVKPKPSYAALLADADLLITTGMDLELWLPSLIDKSGNPKIREGQPGYVAAHYGIKKLEVPKAVDRSQGGVHIYGNPHILTSPLNARIVARNIAIGLIKIDPDNEQYYRERLKKFQHEIDVRLFGEKLLNLLGSETLIRLAESGRLIDFLKQKEFHGKKLIEYLGGWLKKALPLRGKKIVTYHKNWAYFAKLFGVILVGEVEPKPGIPPSAKDVERLVEKMKKEHVKVLLAANYFDESKVRRVCDRVGATPVIVPLYSQGIPQVKTYFDLVDYWIDSLLKAFGYK